MSYICNADMVACPMIVNAERDKSQHCNVIVDVPTRVYSSRLGMRIQNTNSQKHSLRTTRSRVCFKEPRDRDRKRVLPVHLAGA